MQWADHRAVKLGEQRGAVPLVVAGHRSAAPAFVREPLLPASQEGLALAGSPYDLAGAERSPAQQPDPSPPHVLPEAIPARDQRSAARRLAAFTFTMIPARNP
jgi:hypothetical protein